MFRLARWLLALALVATGLAAAPAPAAAAPQDTSTTQAVAKVRNDNISRYLVVVGGDGYRHDIAPQATANVLPGNESRKVWVVAGCTLFKDGKSWASSPPSGGHYKNFGWQITTINFHHVYCG